MPQFGLHQDDAIYFVSAKSLAEGHGYRIDSLPGTPFQTKYPPMLPWLLAPLWKLGPGFPQNLKLAALFAWLMLPPCLLVLRALFRQFGFTPREVWLLTFAAALHPMICLLSGIVMSDLLFLTLFLGSLLVAEQSLDPDRRAWLALAAGIVAGCAFLTRSAALPLAFTAPLCFAYRRQWRRALGFLAGLLPAVAGWELWAAAHRLLTHDPAWLYYTDYLAMQGATVRLDNLASVLWYNSAALLRSLGKLLVFDVALLENVHLERLLGLAALAGVVRLVKRARRAQYPAAAAGFAGLLLAYFFTADERICLPLYPLVLMGFWTEIKNFWSALQRSWHRRQFADRFATVAAAVALSCVAALLAASYAAGSALFLPKLYAKCRRDLDARQAAYAWIRTRTAPGATVNAYDDPVSFLYTGRRTLGMPMPSVRVYAGEAEAAADRFVRDVPRQACEHGLTYLLVTSDDFYREHRAGLLRKVASRDPRLKPVFAADSATVYRCIP